MLKPVTITCRLAVSGHTKFSTSDDPHDEARARANVAENVEKVLAAIKKGASLAIEDSCRSPTPLVQSSARLVVMTSLAPGTDQLVSRLALAQDWELAAVLPGSLADYRASLNAGKRGAGELDVLAEKARALALLELDRPLPVGDGEVEKRARHEAYRMAGTVLLQNADFLLAVIDRKRDPNWFGTSGVIGHALQARIPTIQIHPQLNEVRLLLPDAIDDERPRKIDEELARITQIVRCELSLIDAEADSAPKPPPSHTEHDEHAEIRQRQDENERLRQFMAESVLIDDSNRPPTWREWPMAFLQGVLYWIAERWKDFDNSWRPASQWQGRNYSEPEQIERRIQKRFERLDKLAMYYAGLHRSSIAVLVSLGVLAVLCAALGGVHEFLPHHADHTDHSQEPHSFEELLAQTHAAKEKADREQAARELRATFFCGVELFVLVIMWGIYRSNTRGHWHERSTDYRLLAERLRHAGSLSILGRSIWQYAYDAVPAHYAPRSPHAGWVDRMFRAVLREQILPIRTCDLGANGRQYVRLCRKHLLQNYLGSQIEYHRRNAIKHHRQHELLERFALAGFLLTIVACMVHLLLHSGFLTVLSTTLPAFVAACHGLVAHFHLQRLQKRSEAMQQQLKEKVRSLRMLRHRTERTLRPSSMTLAVWTEEVADLMLREADDWRVVFRLLSVPTPG